MYIRNAKILNLDSEEIIRVGETYRITFEATLTAYPADVVSDCLEFKDNYGKRHYLNRFGMAEIFNL